MPRVLRYTLALFVTALTALLIAALAVTMLVPWLLGHQTRAVASQSMAATGMTAGSLISIEQVDPSEIRIGDVVTYQQTSGKESAVTHRVIGLSTGPDGEVRWQTKGDSNPKPDPKPIRAEQIIGRLVVLDLPLIGPTPYIVPWAGLVVLMPAWQKVIAFLGLLTVFWWGPDVAEKIRARRHREVTQHKPVTDPTLAEPAS